MYAAIQSIFYEKMKMNKTYVYKMHIISFTGLHNKHNTPREQCTINYDLHVAHVHISLSRLIDNDALIQKLIGAN